MSLLKVNEVTDLAGVIPDGVGRIVQVVSTTKTDTFTTTSTTYTDVTGLSASITPTAATSKILILTQIGALGAADNAASYVILTGGNTSGYIGDSAGTRVASITGTGRLNANANGDLMQQSVSINYLDSPATTSSVTYQVQMRVSSGTGGLNRSSADLDATTLGRTASSITLMEIAG